MTRPQALAEFLGTFALVFAGTGAIVIDHVTGGAVTHVGVAMTFGLVVTAMIYALGDVSGAHFNPAVTIAFGLSGSLPKKQIGPYVGCQLAGAILASTLLRLMFGNVAALGATQPLAAVGQSFVLELVLTFLLMLVILSVAHGSSEQGMMAGLAIGATVGLEAMFAGPICGASMNPARSLGPAIVSGQFTAAWIYVAAPILGAAMAVPCWRGMKPAR